MSLETRIATLATTIAARFNASQASTGDLAYSLATAKTGWLLLDGSSIGDVGSGADQESAELEALFGLLKNVYPNTGTELWTSGVVFLPDGRGRVFGGLDDMGGTSAGRITVAGSGVNGTVMGQTGGTETHQLTVSELASHAHWQAHSSYNNNQTGTGAFGYYYGASSNAYPTSSTGSNSPHNNVQPVLLCNAFVKI